MKTTLATALLALGIGLASQAQAMPMLQFSAPGPYNLNAGDTLSVSLQITGLSGNIVSAWDLDVLYDASILNPGAVTIVTTPFGGGDAMFGADFSTPGTLTVWGLSLLSDADLTALQAPYGDTLTLFTMGFSAIADGTTELTVGPLSIAEGKDIKGADNVPILPNPIPEPETPMLIAIAALALAGVRRLAARRAG